MLDPVNTFSGIRYQALAIAFVACYVAPLLPLVVVASALNHGSADRPLPFWYFPFAYVVLFFVSIAPFCSGYLAAKLATRQPLLHGLLVGILAATVFFWIWGRVNSALFAVALASDMILVSLLGAWTWRYRMLRRESDARERPGG
jgi:hypothetical protein